MSRCASAATGDLLAAEVLRLRRSGEVGRFEDVGGGVTPIRLGGDSYGALIDAPLPDSGPWPLAGIADGDLAVVAHHLQQGMLIQVGQAAISGLALPIVPVGEFADRGPVDRDINEETHDGEAPRPICVA